ncbi:FAD/NAD(P)-binding protein [Natrialbaceae archaeon AArc-T1-2]|uniref:FAD/NAD(P)-binding protein n=1 Tax=Natrialbaceae archaeon AArc-T1-2 TaxID=3053904 RepID=UPI00255B0BB5|nr:FAD/NAD(P)-binding protein [Natrialbaceae archaeon AArc-T1-2]WIV66841.1 FAD/NAD(P)-binding protein [Natrialbaceae archaeon AArc-T1-2]
MSYASRSGPLECVIVGGGIHGTYLLQRLLEDAGLDREAVTIVDPHERLLDSFRRKARACEMTELRSTFVHHVGTEPFGLEDFAEARGRTDELLPTPGYPRRPSLSLFLDYADYVIDGNDLAALHRQASVETIRPTASDRDDGLVLETSDGPIRTRHAVLAIGHGGRYRRPDWAEGVDGVTHVWDEFDPDARVDETVVVGGGITACQLATCLAEREAVTVLSRHPVERAVTEADPRWINWNHIESHLHRHPSGSRARYETVGAARNDATVPPYLHDRLEAAVDRGDLAVRRGDIGSARTVDGTVRLLLADGGCLVADRVVLATGFAPVFEHPFVERVARNLDLERGYRGMAVLEDETLAWRRIDGGRSRLFVTGALAAGTVGPLAGNVAGARRSADRIAATLETEGDGLEAVSAGEETAGPEPSA